MKILIISERLGYSSTTSYSLELCQALKERGHSLKVLTLGGAQIENFHAADLEALIVKFNFFSFRKLLHLIREYEPDLVHIQNLRSLSFGLRITESLNLPFLVTIHHLPQSSQVNLSHANLVRVIAVNEVIRESLVNDFLLPKDQIRVLRSGLNLDRFIPGEAPLSLEDGRIPVIGAIGRLSKVKGYEFLLQAARKVLDKGKEVHFLIIGDGEEEASLRKLVRQLELQKQVTFCPPLPDLAELMRNFDILVVPTQRGGLGLTALEAMAMGRPVIANSVGEILHLIRDGETGVLVKDSDPDEIAEKIVQLLENPQQAQDLGARARAYVEENFSLGPMVDSTEQVYQEALEEIALRPSR